MHLYAFGSICRGDIDCGSDIDLLAITEGFTHNLDPLKFSIYSYSRIKQLWDNGNPFAWHLSTESKLIFSSSGDNYLKDLGEPNSYTQAEHHCRNFHQLFIASQSSLRSGTHSPVFELSTIFLSIRNFATCYALGCKGVCEFSRYSCLRLEDKSLNISNEAFSILENARLLNTRGYGKLVSSVEVKLILKNVPIIDQWMNKLIEEV